MVKGLKGQQMEFVSTWLEQNNLSLEIKSVLVIVAHFP